MSHHLTEVQYIDDRMQECIAVCSDCHDICRATMQHSVQMAATMRHRSTIGRSSSARTYATRAVT